MSGSLAGEAAREPDVWGQVPQRNNNFTGRASLLDQLRRGFTTKPLPRVLHGLGGVGKTQLATQYAYQNKFVYDLVWWIPADQPALARSSLATLAPYLGLPPATATGIQDAAVAVLNALRRGEPYARWLLIFDNADQPEDIIELIPGGSGHTLITSRNNRWYGILETIFVDVFSRTESVEFLTKRAPMAISYSAAELLAEELGDLPLALEQAGALHAETGMTTRQYLELLRAQARDLLAESKPSQYPLSMTAAWRVSVSRLSERQPAALELLRCCAFFGPEPIPRNIFRQEARPVGPQLGALLANPILLARVIGDLASFALATINPKTRTIQVHRLIQALLRDDLEPAGQERFRHDVHLLLAGAAPTDPNDESEWARFAELVAHVNPVRVSECVSPVVRIFALNIVRYLYRSGNIELSHAFVEKFREDWSRDSGENHPDVLAANLQLADSLRELGTFHAAYRLTEDTLSRAMEMLGPDNELTLLLMNGFGADLRACGEFMAALKHDTNSRNRHESLLGTTDWRTLNVWNSLALDYGLTSDYMMARELHQRAYVSQSNSASRASKIDVITSWSGLARAVRLSGDYKEARILAEDAYEYGCQGLGATHPWTLRTGKEYSISLRFAGKYAEALELAQSIYDRYHQIFGARYHQLFGKENPDTLAAAVCLANSLTAIGQWEDALIHAEKVLEQYPNVYDQNHPYVHGCAGNLAILLRRTNNITAARERNESALAELTARLGRDHHYPLTIAVNLASDLAGLGETPLACELGKDALARLRLLLGRDHPMSMGCAANLVLDLRAEGRSAQATQLADETYDGLARVLGSDHPSVVAARQSRRLDFDFDPPPI